LSVLPEPAHRAAALPWWWLAFWAAVWRFVQPLLLSSSGAGEPCVWFAGEPSSPWKWEVSSRLGEVQGLLAAGLPVVVALCAWLVARRGDRTWARLWAAFMVAGLAALDYLLQRVQVLLDRVPEGMHCAVDPEAVGAVVSWSLVTTFAPAALALVGAWVAGRGPVSGVSARPAGFRPERSWWPVLVAAALAVLTVAAVTVRLPAGKPEQPLAADGTPRHALMISGGRPAVLDLAEGAAPRMVAAPDPAFFHYTAITRDVTPGVYLAAVSTPGDGAFGGRRSRIHRIVMDGDGGARIGEQVGDDLDGMVLDLAVSPGGRIAYSRVVPVPGATLDIATTFVGLIGPRREWSAPGGHGVGRHDEERLGLHWRDAGTLAFRALPPGGDAPRLVALDVTRPGSGLLATAQLHPLGADANGSGLTLPGGTALAVAATTGGSPWKREIAVVEPSGRRSTVFTSRCGAITAFTVDGSGGHLLVALDGNSTACGRRPREIVQVDLRAGGGSAQRSRWKGELPVSSVAW
jgi:hypothetical protein